MPAARTHDPAEYRMSFGDHLEELRRRLIRALVGVAADVDGVSLIQRPTATAMREVAPGRTVTAWCEPGVRPLGRSSTSCLPAGTWNCRGVRPCGAPST